MDALISAVAGDLVSRFISFLAQKYAQQQDATVTEEDDLERLQSLLRRIHTIVEEAAARRVKNQAMVLQPRDLMNGMYLGHHALDTFKLQSTEEGGVLELEDHEVSHHNSKRLHLINKSTTRSSSWLASGSDSDSTAMLKKVVASLEIKIQDARELVMLLASCPHLPKQPYSKYLFMDKCMFGRHAEKERVISFLLHDDHNQSVLPIVGPHRIGKKTLIHHVYQDERVRSIFSHTEFFRGDDLMNINDINRLLSQPRKCLCIVELRSFGGVDVEAWEMFRSSLNKAAGHGGKIIILGRSDDEIARWGARIASPVRLRSLSREEYWYYFKALAFGSIDPDEHPRLASLGMQLATELNGSFLGANIIGYLLTSNPDAEIWRGILMSLREMTKKCFSIFRDGEHCHPKGHLENNNRVDLAKLSSFMRYRDCLIYGLREDGSHVQSEMPRLTSEGPWMRTGKVFLNYEGLDVLVWSSHIPPFCNYVATFVMQRPRHFVRRKSPGNG